MNLAGYMPTSFVDYPGKLAAVAFTQGCNFRCPYCYNRRLIPRRSTSPLIEEAFMQHLARRKQHLGGVVITGGEPTIQSDLVPFLKRIRPFGLSIKVDTNGSRPAVLNRLIELRLVDYIAMDLKALFADYRKACGTVCPAAALEESITLLRKSGLAYELRTTAVRPSQRDLADLVATGLQATGAPRYYLQPFRRDTSIDPAFVAEAQPFSAAELNRAARYLKQHGIACRVR